MLKGFKDFLLRGNVVDLAIAVVIGAAFTSVVTAFTNAFLKPLIQLFSGGGEFAGKIVVNDVEFDYATFINSTITFVITASVVYFFVVYPMKWLQERRRRGEEDGPAESTDVELLTEIRDLLKEQAEASSSPLEQRTTRLSSQVDRQWPAEQWPGGQQGHVEQGNGYRQPARTGDRGHDDRYDNGYDVRYDEVPERRPARPRRPRSRHSTAGPADAPRR